MKKKKKRDSGNLEKETDPTQSWRETATTKTHYANHPPKSISLSLETRRNWDIEVAVSRKINFFFVYVCVCVISSQPWESKQVISLTFLFCFPLIRKKRKNIKTKINKESRFCCVVVVLFSFHYATDSTSHSPFIMRSKIVSTFWGRRERSESQLIFTFGCLRAGKKIPNVFVVSVQYKPLKSTTAWRLSLVCTANHSHRRPNPGEPNFHLPPRATDGLTLFFSFSSSAKE
jgi:hypothetical protein